MQFEITESAKGDLQAISDYTYEIWGGAQQERYLSGLYDKFQEIGSDPARWRFRNDLFPHCQIAQYGRHVILFIYDNNLLTVVRVLHDAMDFKRHLSED